MFPDVSGCFRMFPDVASTAEVIKRVGSLKIPWVPGELEQPVIIVTISMTLQNPRDCPKIKLEGLGLKFYFGLSCNFRSVDWASLDFISQVGSPAR